MSKSVNRRATNPTPRVKGAKRNTREVGPDPIDIDHPIGAEDVNGEMGLNDVSTSGSISFNPDEFELVRVTGTTFVPGNAPPDTAGGNAQEATNVNGVSGDWSFPVLSGASCNSTGTSTNGVKIWCTLRKKSDTTESTFIKTGNFNGHCINTLAAGGTTLATPPFPVTLPGIPVEYSKKVGKWLFYSNLSVSHRHEGSLLFADGKALRGSKISVAAADVNWRTHDESDTHWLSVKAAKGQSAIATTDWHFPALNKFAICVWQYGGFAKVVKSESKTNPTKIIGLNKFKPLLVQVNDRTGQYADNAGSFDLWIRIDAP